MGGEELSATRIRNKKRRQSRKGRVEPRAHYEYGGSVVKHRVSDEQFAASRVWLRDYINKYCIVRNTRMPGKAPGSWYSWMFYLRKGLFNPEFIHHVGTAFVHQFERIDPDFNFQITGLETAATPMLVGIAMVAKTYGIDLNAYVVRKTRKEYGLLNVFEGRPNQKISIVIDDLCNSGRSMAQAVSVLDAENMEVGDVAFAIVNKSNYGVHSAQRLNTDMHLPDTIQVVSLFTLDDFGLSDPSH